MARWDVTEDIRYPHASSAVYDFVWPFHLNFIKNNALQPRPKIRYNWNSGRPALCSGLKSLKVHVDVVACRQHKWTNEATTTLKNLAETMHTENTCYVLTKEIHTVCQHVWQVILGDRSVCGQVANSNGSRRPFHADANNLPVATKWDSMTCVLQDC